MKFVRRGAMGNPHLHTGTLVMKIEDVGLLAHITFLTRLTPAVSTSRQAKESMVLIGHGYRCRGTRLASWPLHSSLVTRDIT